MVLGFSLFFSGEAAVFVLTEWLAINISCVANANCLEAIG